MSVGLQSVYCVLSSAVEQVDANKQTRGENVIGNLHYAVMSNIWPVRYRIKGREGNMRCIL